MNYYEKYLKYKKKYLNLKKSKALNGGGIFEVSAKTSLTGLTEMKNALITTESSISANDPTTSVTETTPTSPVMNGGFLRRGLLTENSLDITSTDTISDHKNLF
tara:strand:- start:581 stop:892 length:312 start_codon:yes stop_codon:yes gene_type:complete